jgi:hypothetical protein
MTFAFILDNFVYVFGPDTKYLEKIKVEGVFQNPREISNFKNADGNLSYDPDVHDYPLSTSMLDLIKSNMMAINMKSFVETLTDLSNNAKSGSDQVYKYYKQKTIPELQVDKQIFREICDEFNKLMIEKILLNSEEIRLPYRLGALRVKKSKMKYDDKNKLKIDWAASKKLGKRIYHLNDHTGGYKYRFYWTKGIVKNITAYSFIPTRTNTRTLASILKDKNRQLDYFM